MHEVVTLQFGEQANYIGTHYWNTQEAYFTYTSEDQSPVDHDVSFRPGIGADGSDTYTPRTVIYDLKGAFGTLRRENALYEIQHQEHPAQHGPWSGATVPLQLPPILPSAYQQALDRGIEPPSLTTQAVRFWSDYNHIFYHPRSIVQLNDYELNSSLMPFERWSTGEELFMNLDREHDLLDRDLRLFLEECDQLQGIQVLSSTDDAWGGFASKYLERVADDLGKGCRWVFGLQDSNRTARERNALQLANVAQSMYNIDPSASMHIPLSNIPSSLPAYVSLDTSSRWHTSALQAAAIESTTLPTRLRSMESARATFDNMESTLNGDGLRRIAGCSMSVSDCHALEEHSQPNGHTDSRITNGYAEGDSPEHSNKKADFDLSPEIVRDSTTARTELNRSLHVFSRVESLRGPWRSDAQLQEIAERLRSQPHAYDARVSTHQSSLLFPVLSSFPTVFRLPTRPQYLAIEAYLSTSTAIAGRIRSLERVSRRVVGADECEALCDRLAAMADEYEEGWDSDEDIGDDD